LLPDTSSRSWFIEIDDFYVQSAVSYYGLNALVPHFSRALAVVKGGYVDPSRMSPEKMEKLRESVHKLYGLLHQRFAVTEDGLRKLHQKYSRGVYGKCPRLACNKQNLLPFGVSAELDIAPVKVWCTRCHDVYQSESDLDGAYFGPDIPVMFHKVLRIPLRWRADTNWLDGYEKDDGTVVQKIKPRLLRWGEPRRE
jgi:casein kinase II subunit beta